MRNKQKPAQELQKSPVPLSFPQPWEHNGWEDTLPLGPHEQSQIQLTPGQDQDQTEITQWRQWNERLIGLGEFVIKAQTHEPLIVPQISTRANHHYEDFILVPRASVTRFQRKGQQVPLKKGNAGSGKRTLLKTFLISFGITDIRSNWPCVCALITHRGW